MVSKPRTPVMTPSAILNKKNLRSSFNSRQMKANASEMSVPKSSCHFLLMMAIVMREALKHDAVKNVSNKNQDAIGANPPSIS